MKTIRKSWFFLGATVCLICSMIQESAFAQETPREGESSPLSQEGYRGYDEQKVKNWIQEETRQFFFQEFSHFRGEKGDPGEDAESVLPYNLEEQVSRMVKIEMEQRPVFYPDRPFSEDLERFLGEFILGYIHAHPNKFRSAPFSAPVYSESYSEICTVCEDGAENPERIKKIVKQKMKKLIETLPAQRINKLIESYQQKKASQKVEPQELQDAGDIPQHFSGYLASRQQEVKDLAAEELQRILQAPGPVSEEQLTQAVKRVLLQNPDLLLEGLDREGENAAVRKQHLREIVRQEVSSLRPAEFPLDDFVEEFLRQNRELFKGDRGRDGLGREEVLALLALQVPEEQTKLAVLEVTLQSAVENFGERIAKAKMEAKAEVKAEMQMAMHTAAAISNALSGIPDARSGERRGSLGSAVGYYGGKQAWALGGSYSVTPRTVVKFGLATDVQVKNLGMNAGVAVGF